MSTVSRSALHLLSAHIWQGHEMARSGADGQTWSTGHAALDAALPGGGWPVCGLVELLAPRPGQFVWRLVAPGLSQLLAQKAGPLVLVGAPFEPFSPSLQARGLPPGRLLCVQTPQAPVRQWADTLQAQQWADTLQARLWAAQQALQCAAVVAVLLWLEPPVRTASGYKTLPSNNLSLDLRRLHLIAQTRHKPLFVMRPEAARQEASAAPLRLSLRDLAADAHSQFEVDVFKRRGCPLAQPLSLAAQPEQLAALLVASARLKLQREAEMA